MNQTFNITQTSMVDFQPTTTDAVTPILCQTGLTFNANPKSDKNNQSYIENKYKDELYDTVYTDHTNNYIVNHKFGNPFIEAAPSNLPMLNQKGMRSTVMTGN